MISTSFTLHSLIVTNTILTRSEICTSLTWSEGSDYIYGIKGTTDVSTSIYILYYTT